MKRIVILEDKPERLKKMIEQVRSLNQNEVEMGEVLYYHPSLELVEESQEVRKLTQELGTMVKITNLFNFDQVLDSLFEQPDNLFIFNVTVTEGLCYRAFSYRINVNYALRKQKQGDQRIWFYTVAGPDYKRNIDYYFEKYVLEASLGEDEQLELQLQESQTLMNAIKKSHDG